MISDNIVESIPGDGIALGYKSNNNTFINNTVSGSFDGISLTSSRNNTFTDTIAFGNKQCGISIGTSSYNNRFVNTTTKGNNWGISVSSSDNNIFLNLNSSNNQYGVDLSNSNSTIITQSTISNNLIYGLSPAFYNDNSYNITIYNNFLNNTQNIMFYKSNPNTWNITKTSGTNIIGGAFLGGNYWANPSGTGFSQTSMDANGDGICDSAYTIGTGNIDYLPLGGKRDTTPPVILPISNPTPVLPGANVVINATVTDNAGVAGANATVNSTIYTMTAVDGIFGGTNEAVSVTIPASVLHIGTNIVTITASDAAGNTVTAPPFIVTITNPNHPPILDPIASQTVTKGQTLIITVSANDSDGDELVYTADNLPAGATFDSVTRTFSWTPDVQQLGTYHVVFSVKDSIASDSETVKITINDPNTYPLAITTDQYVNTVSTVDLSHSPALITILGSTIGQPMDVAVSPDYSRALVSGTNQGEVIVFDLTQAPAQEISRISVGGRPQQIAITPDGRKAIVGNSQNYNITILDISDTSPSILQEITLSGNPYGVGITNDGNYALVSVITNPGKLYVIDLKTTPATIKYSLNIAKYSEFIGMDPNGKTAVVTMFDMTGNVTIVDLTTEPFTVKGYVLVGHNPGSEPAITPDGKYALVGNSDDDTLSVIDVSLSSPAVVKTLSVGDDPRGVGIIDTQNVALVANRGVGNSLTKIDLNTLTVIGTITGLASPNHVSVYYKVKVNNPPALAMIGNKTLNEGEQLNFNLSAIDADGDPLTYNATGVPRWATFNPVTKTFSGTPGYSDAGSSSVTFSVTDGSLTDTEVITITINNVNRAPVAAEQSVTTDENIAEAITLTATDGDNDPMTFSVVTGPAHGTLSGTAPALTYTPTANYNGADSFTFKANDGTADSNTATVSITVNLVNVAPVAAEQSVTTDENIAEAITLTATDGDNDPMTFSVVTGPAHGTLSGTAPALTYTPTANYNGADSFTFKANDGTADSNTATVSITVNLVNIAPVAAEQSVTTDENIATAITLTATDADNDPMTFSVVTGPAHGTLSGTAPDLTYTPTANYNGADSFTFKANDSLVDSNTATVSITVNLVNVAPVAAEQSVTTDENIATAITLTATDGDNDPMTFSVVTGPAHGTLSGTAPALTYTPTANYNGADSFTFKANDSLVDSNTATVSIIVNLVNVAPVAADQSVTTDENIATAITLTATDGDNDPMTFSVVTGPAHGTLSGTAPALTYTPTANFNGADSFTFKANDGLVDSNTATVSIIVNLVNVAPVAAEQSVTTDENIATAITLTATDGDNDPMTFSVVTGPAHGTLSGTAPDLTYTPTANYNGADSFTFKANDSLVDSNIATVSITVNLVNVAPVAAEQSVTTDENIATPITLTATDGDNDPMTFSVVTGPAHGTLSGIAPDLTYTPTANYNGADSFTFKANDSLVDSNIATVSIIVNLVNVAPVAAEQSVTTDENIATAITLTATDGDNDPMTFSVVTGPAHGTLSGTAPDLTYTPTANYNGADSFTFKANDSLVDSNTATVSIIVNVNQPPNIDENSVLFDSSITEGEALIFIVRAEGTIPLVYNISPLDGASINPSTGEFIYTAPAGSAGSYDITITVTDANTLTDSVTIHITVTSVPIPNQPPVLSTIGNKTKNVGELLTFSINAIDPDGNPLTYSASGLPANATFTGTTFTWTPALNQVGTHTVTFTVSDGSLSDSETITITVTSVINPNLPPVLDPIGNQTASQGQLLTFTVSAFRSG